MSFFSSLFGTAQQTDAIKILSVTEFKEAINKKEVQLVDVRTAQEYKQGHIKGAFNIDFFKQLTFNESFEKFDKNKSIYIYCRSGNRSQKAARKLVKLGFKDIYDLRGGYLAWEDQ